MVPLLVLGLLQQLPNANGYELLAYLRDRHLTYVVHVTKGSFYYHLQQLTAKGFLRVQPGSAAKENRYQVTPSGQTEFRRLFQKYGQVNDVTALNFYAVLLFAEQARDLMPALLASQIQQTEAKIRATEDALATPDELDPQYALILTNTVAHHRVNLDWLRQLSRRYP